MKTKYFYIEPYAYISIGNDCALIYNTLNKKILTYGDSSVINFCKQLINKKGVIKLEDNYKPITNFIEDLKANFLGDVFFSDNNSLKPVTIISDAVLLKNIEVNPNIYKNNSLNYLHELTVYLNDECLYDCKHCKTTYKQTLSCVNFDSGKQLDFSFLEDIISKVSIIPTFRVLNVIGGNIFKYKHIDKLISLVKSNNIDVNVIINSNQWERRIFKLFDAENIIITVTFSNDWNEKLISEIINEDFNFLKLKFKFLIFSIEDIERLDNIIKISKDIQVQYIPIYDNKNDSFFEENIFLTEETILLHLPSEKNIHRNQKLNSLFFGKLFIMPNGDVFDNLNNSKCIGSIYNNNLATLVYNSIKDGKYWTLTRNCSESCSKCIYKDICPPISNYELVLNKDNLCTILQ